MILLLNNSWHLLDHKALLVLQERLAPLVQQAPHLHTQTLLPHSLRRLPDRKDLRDRMVRMVKMAQMGKTARTVPMV
jgi:hypothetical protein